jgi:2-hydroxychromene-2-carboxylate isomerase
VSDPIKFYFDFSSPYSYFGALKIDGIAGSFDREVEWHPMLLGVAFKATGNVSLAHQPIKSDYAMHDIERMARFMDIPWKWADKFPIATQAAARSFYWINDNDPVLAKKFALACFENYFSKGINISGRDAVADVAEGMGIDRDDLLTAIITDEFKQRLRDETDAAIAAGVCGAPFFIVDGEPVWGSDRLWMIRRWLKSGGW